MIIDLLPSVSRRLTAVGLRVERSPVSETLYLALGPVSVRISHHELGVADYGSRPQRHRGPEAILPIDLSPAAALRAIYEAVREYCPRPTWAYDRRSLAHDLRRFRAAMRRAQKNAARDARAAARRAARAAARREAAERAAAEARRARDAELARDRAEYLAQRAAEHERRATRRAENIRLLLAAYAANPTPGRRQALAQYGIYDIASTGDLSV